MDFRHAISIATDGLDGRAHATRLAGRYPSRGNNGMVVGGGPRRRL